MTAGPAAGQVVAAIIAGGRGTRLGGRDKGQVLVGGQTILQRQLAVLRPLFPRILLVRGEVPAPGPEGLEGVEAVSDRGPAGQGPLAGIDAALAALRPDERAVVCLAADMPFLHPRVVTLLRDHPTTAAALVATAGGHPEPLCARYTRACAAPVADALAAGRLRAAALLDVVAVERIPEDHLRALDPPLLTLENLNTPDDLTRLEALALTHGR